MVEDKLLLWKFKRGSAEALEHIYDKYESYLLGVAVGLVNDAHAAEDILGEFFVGFVQSADKVRLKGNLKAYMAVCVANLARNKVKRRRLEPGTLDGSERIESVEAGPVAAAIKKEETEAVSLAVAQLPYEQREVVVLHLQGNMKFTQIAKLRGTSVNTIRSRYRYGLEKLRSLLNSEVNNEIA